MSTIKDDVLFFYFSVQQRRLMDRASTDAYITQDGYGQDFSGTAILTDTASQSRTLTELSLILFEEEEKE